MATQFDADIPSNVQPVMDIADLSDDAIDHAISACETARTGPHTGPNRRFNTQLGRAYAARAVRLAASADHQDEARALMNKAIDQWKAAESQGSAAAKNFLGAVYRGTFNSKDFKFFEPQFDTALKYWLDGAALHNIKATRNAASLLLFGNSEYRGVTQDVEKAIQLFKTAIDGGDMSAAGIYGQALFYGYPQGVRKNPAEGVRLLTRACNKGDATAADFFTREFAKTNRSPALPQVRPDGC